MSGHIPAEEAAEMFWNGSGMFTESKMQVRYRVVGYGNGEKAMLFSSEIYRDAEEWIWSFIPYSNGPVELWIEKVWVKK